MDHLKLAAACGANLEHAVPYAKPLTELMQRFEINTVDRIAAFLANVRHETANLAKVQEDLYYTTPARLREVFPSLFVPPKGKQPAEQYVRNSAALSKLRYAGYHGRGLMHLTWKENYALAGAALGFDYVKNPELLVQPWHACASACWYWSEYKDLNRLADKVDLFEIRRLINGDRALGFVETKRFRLAALAVLRSPIA